MEDYVPLMFQNSPKYSTKGKKVKPTRSRSGCFTCRRKKKKCDETKPRCLGCTKSSLECIWPIHGGSSLPHQSNFEPRKISENKRFQFIVSYSNGSKLKKAQKVHEAESIDYKLNLRRPKSPINVVLNSTQGNGYGQITLGNDTPGTFDKTTTKSKFVEDCEIYDYEDVLPLSPSSRSLSSLNMPGPTDPSEMIDEECNFHLEHDLEKSDKSNYLDSESSYESDQLIDDNKLPILSSIYMNGYKTWIPGVQLSSEDAYFYNVFINGFIVAISPQLARPELMPGAIFVPQGASSPILREIFYVCGASYLSWRMPDLKNLVQKKYVACLDKLAGIINSPGIDGTEDWMLVAMLLLCLREKFYGALPIKPAVHITMACKIMKKRQRRKFKRFSEQEIFLKNETSESDFLQQTLALESYNSTFGDNIQDSSREEIHSPNKITSQECSQLVEINNSNSSRFIKLSSDMEMIQRTVSTSAVDVSATEKLLIESFIYNYSVLLLICDRKVLSFLPSPFEIFNEYKSILYTRIYDCPVPWMNNPVLGAALRAFEIAAKASWLCFKSPLDNESRILAEKLYNDSLNYNPPTLSADVETVVSKEVYRRLKESTIVAEVVAKVAQILLAKILNSNLSQADETVQKIISNIYDSLQLLSPSSLVWSICGWPLVVFGMATISPAHREFIKAKCIMLSEFLHAEYMTQIVSFLTKAWGNDLSPGPGWDLLFDGQSLQIMCI